MNLNTATLEELDTLDGVGPATAQKILDFRTEHGGFGAVDELDQIPGIGERRLAALRDHVRVSTCAALPDGRGGQDFLPLRTVLAAHPPATPARALARRRRGGTSSVRTYPHERKRV